MKRTSFISFNIKEFNNLYYNKKLSMREICRKYNISPRILTIWMIKHHCIFRKIKGGRKRINLINKRFGKLIVLESIIKNKKLYYKCKCDCGNFKIYSAKSIRRGRINNCGCNNFKTKNRIEIAQHYLYRSYKFDSKRHNRNYDFNLSFEEFINLTKQNCYYCNKTPLQICKRKDTKGNLIEYIYNGIDRIDNDKGYELNNCVPCCKDCNRSKFRMKKLEFIHYIIDIYNNLKRKGY